MPCVVFKCMSLRGYRLYVCSWMTYVFRRRECMTLTAADSNVWRKQVYTLARRLSLLLDLKQRQVAEERLETLCCYRFKKQMWPFNFWSVCERARLCLKQKYASAIRAAQFIFSRLFSFVLGRDFGRYSIHAERHNSRGHKWSRDRVASRVALVELGTCIVCSKACQRIFSAGLLLKLACDDVNVKCIV